MSLGRSTELGAHMPTDLTIHRCKQQHTVIHLQQLILQSSLTNLEFVRLLKGMKDSQVFTSIPKHIDTESQHIVFIAEF